MTPLLTPAARWRRCVQVCAKCTLRMRLLYEDTRCPLCMTTNETVVMVRPARAEGE